MLLIQTPKLTNWLDNNNNNNDNNNNNNNNNNIDILLCLYLLGVKLSRRSPVRVDRFSTVVPASAPQLV